MPKRPRPSFTRFSFITSFALVAATAPRVHADKVDDFREASTHTGCDSIPYTDLRNQCRSQQADVHPWCDGSRGPGSCASGITRNLKSDQVTAQRELATLEDRKRDLEDRKLRASDDNDRAKLTTELEGVEKLIAATKARLDALRADLEQRADVIAKTLHTINRCIDYRRAVMNVFAYATDKVRGDNEPSVNRYVEKLRVIYAESIDGHEEQIVSRTKAIENCEKERP
jgi:hypothetical protein